MSNDMQCGLIAMVVFVIVPLIWAYWPSKPYNPEKEAEKKAKQEEQIQAALRTEPIIFFGDSAAGHLGRLFRNKAFQSIIATLIFIGLLYFAARHPRDCANDDSSADADNGCVAIE